jgi:uncharacterized protein YegL
MRRLPVYFLIDVSESMVGEPIQQVEAGLGMIIQELKRDPYALETVYVSIVAFAGKAKTITPLTDVISFYPPRLPVGGGTALGEGLNHLMRDMGQTLVRTTMERKGDWKPIVFIFTDGAPTDSYQSALDTWNRDWKNKSQVVAVSFGSGADLSVLYRLTDNVMLFKNSDANSYKAFFKWITASIQASSQSVNMYSKEDLSLAPIDKNLMDQMPPGSASGGSSTVVDVNVATFLAKCQNTKKHYLIKYDKAGSAANSDWLGAAGVSRGYRLSGAFAVGDEYFQLTQEGASNNAKVNSDDLQGVPHCPCCGNSIGMALCPCGNIFCVDERSNTATCPWCQRNLRTSDDGSSSSFDISRTRG